MSKAYPLIGQKEVKPRPTKVTSAAIQAQADKARKHSILAVKGISRGKLMRIEPEEFNRLDVDPTYQRGETNFVSSIVTAIQRGGAVLDPVTLCKRTSWGNREKLWVVDGHQRVCAFQQTSTGFDALVHESESLEAERIFFLALNSRRGMSANLIVKSWPGHSGKLLVLANASAEHPLYERINLEQGNNRSRIGAMVVVRSTFTAATGLEGHGTANMCLSRLDVALGVDAKRLRADAFLRLLGKICPKGKINVNVAEALAITAFERWENGPPALPTQKQIDHIKGINWENELPVLARKYRPVMQGMINRWWK